MSRAAQRSATQEPSAETVAAALAPLRKMLMIRAFELEMQRLFLKGEVHGTTHLYNGQEASAVGICSALEKGDHVAATYRGHGAALAMGITPEELAAELCGRVTGVDGGRGGSMNVIDLERGLVGCFGIVGGSIAAATGAALTHRVKRTGGVAVAFFGDGATNQGYFHECLNFAAVRSLPVVFVCENNGYGEFTAMERVTAGADIAARAAVYGMPSRKVDGNTVGEVAEAARDAVTHARSTPGPVFLECRTYRHLGHSKSDPGKYRTEEEHTSWLERDPIELEKVRLLEADGIEQAHLTALEQDVKDELAGAIERALAAPITTPETATVPATEYAP